MARDDYEIVIGLEVHAELSTKNFLGTSKIRPFSPYK